MESEAVVARLDGQIACVEVKQVGAGCGHCHEAGGCGSSLLSQPLGGNRRWYRLPNTIGAAPGDSVVISVREGAVLSASLLAYMLPVLLAIIGAALGTALATSDIAAVLGAGFGLALSLLAQGHAFRREPLLSMRLKCPVINHSEDSFS